jgi:hypothetical protein
MRIFTRLTAALTVGLIAFGSIVYAAEAPSIPPFQTYTPLREAPIASERLLEAPIVFRHGDISWLPQLAAQAGWPERTWKRLGHIILRESGGCPNRRGGDAVNKFCEITHVTEWNHRSDTGLLQINGVNYDLTRNRWAVVCNQMGVCEQEPLLDPLTNLKAGYLLWQVAGWGPWKRNSQ